MKQISIAVLLAVVALLCCTSSTSFAAASDTLVVYASGKTLDAVITADTLVGGAQAHLVYKLPTRDTTYIFDGAITLKSGITVLGVLDPVTKRPPTIQPDVLGDNSIPGLLFGLNGTGASYLFKNLYLLDIAVNNTPNGAGIAIEVHADNVRLAVDNCVFDTYQNLAIGYSGANDKFFVTNCKFRNMVHPNQWYIGEVLRNEWPGAVATDSTVFRYNTMFCVNGYAACPVSKAYVKYFEFTHNNVIYTFKNPLFIFNVTNAKVNNNIFYGTFAGGVSKTEYPWWDELWSPEVGSVIDLDTLDLAKDTVFNPADVAKANFRTLSEQKRAIELKNNAYFWPATLTAGWKAWNDTAHVDSIYTPTWMNTRTTGIFTDHTTWPGVVQSGNQNVDPAFGSAIPGIVNQASNGLLAWFALCRQGALSTTYWGYGMTSVGSSITWVPTWPLPEATAMAYTNSALKTGATDGLQVGDPNWFGLSTAVQEQPVNGVAREFALNQNYPNPFNPSTKIQFTLPATSVVRLSVFNVLGQEVATLASGVMNAGVHEVTFDASHLASGVYMYKVTAGSFVSTKKMMLLK